MKKITFFVFTVFFLTGILSIIPQGFVHAQDPVCTNAAGEVIPCPQEPNKEDNNQKKTPTPVPPTVTPTPLPLSAAPTPTPFPDENYLGSCSQADGNIADCLEKYKCEDGLLVVKVDLYTGNGTKYDFYCIPHDREPFIEFPITSLPEGDGTAKWDVFGGVCDSGDGYNKCMSDFLALCDEVGGLYDEVDIGSGTLTKCEVNTQTVAPTAAPAIIAAAPEDDGTTSDEDWDESCSWASCWAYDLTCAASGGSGYGTEDGAGGVVYHCDMPADAGNTKPPSAWLPWLGLTTGVILIGLLLPAVQKVREAAARKTGKAQNRRVEVKLSRNHEEKEENESNADDGGDDEGFITRYQKRAKRSE